MSRRNNLMLGVIAGASFALGYWLNSDKGREFRKDAEDTVHDAYEKGQKTAHEAWEKTSEKVNEVIDTSVDMMQKARDVAAEAERKVKEKVGATS